MTPTLIQILRWLMQPRVWRCVGFASAVVGLLCYALSSSFNHLFGDWNLLKIFLYTAFSFTICLLILLAMIWQHSRSLRFKAQLAFLVLTITAVYSFFSDKVMSGKPDAYSLISCTAFAVMSLSLSRQTECGFEVDLMYFYLGCLIVQLMKIKPQLVVVGAGFSYSLIILRSSFSSIDAGPDNEYPGLEDENSVVLEVDSPQLDGADIASSMVEQLRTCVKGLQQENSNIISRLLEHVKEYLEDDSEFMVTDPNFMIDALLPETINNLQETAKLMVSGGFAKEFSEVYNCCRRECLEECLLNKLFGLQDINIEDVHKMPLKDLKYQIERWSKISNVAFKILFPIERRLCDRVFFGFSSNADFSFTEICRGSTIQLLNFADAVAVGSRSMKQLFTALEVFETLRDLIMEPESLFCDQYNVSVRNGATAISKRLGEAIRGIFTELKNLIRQDPVEAAVPGGGIHPITGYVTNYLCDACDYRKTLELVFEEDCGHSSKEHPKLGDRVHSSSSLSVQMDSIMELLESNLEAKSKIYKDPALCYFFLMNNSTYITQNTKDSGLGALLGDDWIRKHTAKARQYHALYKRSSWNKVLQFLKLESNGPEPPNEVAKSMKEKLEMFDMHFEEICRVQSSWFVHDEQLEEHLRISIEEMLLPAYRNFIGGSRVFQNLVSMLINILSMERRILKQDSTLCFMEAVVDQLVADWGSNIMWIGFMKVDWGQIIFAFSSFPFFDSI